MGPDGSAWPGSAWPGAAWSGSTWHRAGGGASGGRWYFRVVVRIAADCDGPGAKFPGRHTSPSRLAASPDNVRRSPRLPQFAPRRARGLTLARAFVLMAASMLALLTPATASADPPQPLPGYQPAFVTEREDGPWRDCVWASAAMLLDKWTSGETIVSRQRLRALSGDGQGGSGLRDVQAAFARLGFRLTISPYDSVAIDWSDLLDRLAAGGGAILLGDYGLLPAQFGRWDPAFWSRTGELDDHALYLDRYDQETGRILVMDPLAPAGWGGEWIPVSALKRFAWRSGSGALSVAITPPALTSAFEGVSLGTPTATADAAAVHLAWPIGAAPAGWTDQGTRLTTQIVPVEWVDPLAWIVGALPANATARPPMEPVTSSADGMLRASIPLPAAPGIYSVSVSLADQVLGQLVAGAGPFNLYVPGPRAAAYEVPDRVVAAAGSLAHIPVRVTNVGSESWAEAPFLPWLSSARQGWQNLRLTGTWVREPSAATAGTVQPRPPESFERGFLHLEAGDSKTIDAAVRMPVDAGSWRLVFDLVDDLGQSLAATGSAPGVIIVETVVPGPGLEGL